VRIAGFPSPSPPSLFIVSDVSLARKSSFLMMWRAVQIAWQRRKYGSMTYDRLKSDRHGRDQQN
jgi:hypothetical protein